MACASCRDRLTTTGGAGRSGYGHARAIPPTGRRSQVEMAAFALIAAAARRNPARPADVMRGAMRSIVLIPLLFAISACAAPPPPSVAPPSAPARPPVSDTLALPTDPPIEMPPGAVAACGGIALSAVLDGDVADPRLAWLVADPGRRVDLTWPPGYRARFTPHLEVLDARGVVVLKEGDPVSGACVTPDPRVLHLEPPF